MPLDRKHAIVGALRSRGSETQVTDSIHAVCAGDPAFAAGFVRAVLAAAPHAQGLAEIVPRELNCAREVVTDEGRVDLVFTDGAGQWHVLVELKLHADYGRHQLTRYLSALDREARHHALVAITRTVPRSDEPFAAIDRAWSGSIRWSRVLNELRALVPADPELARQWPLLLDVLEEEGAMGYTKPDPKLLEAWTLTRQARQHVELLLDSIQDRLAHSIGSLGSEPDALRLLGGPGRGAIRHGSGDIVLEFGPDPVAGPPRLRVGLRGYQPPLRVVVGFARPEGPSATEAARRALMEAHSLGYAPRRSSRFSYTRRIVEAEELGQEDLPERIATWIEAQVAALGATGVLAVPLGAPVAISEESDDEAIEPA